MQQKTTLSKEDTSTHVPSKVSPRHLVGIALQWHGSLTSQHSRRTEPQVPMISKWTWHDVSCTVPCYMLNSKSIGLGIY